MKQDEITPNIVTYITLINLCIKKSDLRSVVKLLKLFQQVNGQEETENFIKDQNSLLQQIFKGLNNHNTPVEELKLFFVDLIQQISKQNIIYFVEQTIKLQVIEPVILMFQYYKNNTDVQFSTIKAFRQMHPYLIQKYYKTLVDKYLQLDKIEDHIAIQLLELVLKMNDITVANLLMKKVEENFKDKPNLYSTLVRGLVSQRLYEPLIKQYEKFKLIPDLDIPELVYGQIIDCCVKCGKLDKAKQVLEESDKSNTVMYTTLIKGYSKQKNFTQAFEIFNSMKQNSNNSTKPNVITYNSLLECAVQAQEFDKLTQIFNEIVEQSSDKSNDLEADLITYSTYIKGLCKGKKIKEALSLFEDVRKSKTNKIDEVLYNSLLDGLYKAGELQVCLKVYDYMKEDDIKLSNVTYSILIKLYNQLEQYQSAFDILEIMKTRFIKPGIIVYTCIVQTCVRTKNMKKLVEIYDQMKEQEVIGDSVFYNTLISGMMYNSYIKSALDITLDTLKNKIFLNTDVYSNLVKNLIRVYERRSSVYNRNNAQQTSLSEEEVEKGLLQLIQAFKLSKIKIDSETFQKAEYYIFKKDKKQPLSLNKQNSDNYSSNQGIQNRQKNKSFFQRRPVQNQLSQNSMEQKVTYVVKKENNEEDQQQQQQQNNSNTESARKRAKTFTSK